MSIQQLAPPTSPKGAFILGAGSALVAALVLTFSLRHSRYASAVPVLTPSQREATTQASRAPEVLIPVSPAPPASSAHKMPLAANPTDKESLVSGVIVLDHSSAHRFTGHVIVFVIARSGSGKGHPVLARRLDVASFPVAFSLGPQDSMMGQALPGNVSLEARIDFDGDAMTREPNASSARIDSVAIGTHNVTLILKPGV